MKKNPEKNFTVVEVDPITGDYFVKIPEWMMTELGWYEDTEVKVILEGNEIVITERKYE
ncbi:AbrB/MazE/SpoVT family DNA-binding domain-containing protein [bacterium]|jgi:hypothetical protein|nr:AbrB/MazE/SpoVT family DNA-binding domain-containing protein [bacterium]